MLFNLRLLLIASDLRLVGVRAESEILNNAGLKHRDFSSIVHIHAQCAIIPLDFGAAGTAFSFAIFAPECGRHSFDRIWFACSFFRGIA